MCPTLTLLLDITYHRHSFTRSHNRAQQSIYSLTSFPITQEYCPTALTHSQTASRLHSLGPMRVGPHRLQIVIVNRRRFPGVPLLHHRHSHSLFFTISSSVVLKVWHLPYYDLYPSVRVSIYLLETCPPNQMTHDKQRIKGISPVKRDFFLSFILPSSTLLIRLLEAHF